MQIAKFLSSYLRAEDLTQDITVTIDSVEEVNFKKNGQPEQKLIVHVLELDQGIVCNKTMLRQLAQLLSSGDTDNWLGKKVVLFKDPNVVYQGKQIGGLRFRPAPSELPF